RIHPMTEIELLLDAFAILRNQHNEVALVIAGEGEEAYRRQLKERARRSDLRTGSGSGSACPTNLQEEDTRIVWTGHLSGEMKAAALAAADGRGVPAAAESFAMDGAERV